MRQYCFKHKRAFSTNPDGCFSCSLCDERMFLQLLYAVLIMVFCVIGLTI